MIYAIGKVTQSVRMFLETEIPSQAQINTNHDEVCFAVAERTQGIIHRDPETDELFVQPMLEEA